MRPAQKILSQSLLILTLSGACAFGVNALRPDGLPLAQAAPKAAPSAVQLAPAGGEIAIKDAAVLFLSGRAVFLDARSGFEFQLGHIKGAISLPVRSFASDFQDVKPRLAGKDAVIAYCDGKDCPLSHALAKHLVEAGVRNVYVLVNGWSLWQAEKLPVAQGMDSPADAPGQSSSASQAAPRMSTAASQAAARTSQAPRAAKSGKGAGKNGAKLCTDCEN